MGITYKGKEVEERFCKLTGAKKLASNSKMGDAILDGTYIEIKNAAGGTVNQVRPFKGCVLVVNDSKNWFVVPPLDVINMVKGLKGQHTPIPYICVCFRITKIKNYKINETSLVHAVKSASETELPNKIKEIIDNYEQSMQQTITQTITDIERVLSETTSYNSYRKYRSSYC